MTKEVRLLSVFKEDITETGVRVQLVPEKSSLTGTLGSERGNEQMT